MGASSEWGHYKPIGLACSKEDARCEQVVMLRDLSSMQTVSPMADPTPAWQFTLVQAYYSLYEAAISQCLQPYSLKCLCACRALVFVKDQDTYAAASLLALKEKRSAAELAAELHVTRTALQEEATLATKIQEGLAALTSVVRLPILGCARK